MKSVPGIGLADVQAVYSGPEGRLWELIMGEQIHMGGFTSSMDLAETAQIGAGTKGVDLCCCNGAGMRFLVRFRNVARMQGVDATETVVEQGRQRCQQAGLADRIQFIGRRDQQRLRAACDFVWGGCVVLRGAGQGDRRGSDRQAGGTIAFTDWVEGDKGLSQPEAERYLRFMKFPSVLTMGGYCDLLKANGCDVLVAKDTGRFGPYVDLYLNMLGMQLTYDALKIIGFDQDMMKAMAGEMAFMQQLAHAGKIAQGLFVARKR
jgi:hypothetical protein